MRWVIGFVLLLLALGTLRVVGCGDDGPECIYPLDYAAGTVRDPACDDENECTEGRCYYGNTCSNESAFRDGEPCDSGSVPDACSIDICVDGRCERTEKPCEHVPHEECGEITTYDCDPDTGVVECTLDTAWRQGYSCCLDSTTDCVITGSGLDCGWRCLRGGWCIDGGCVIGNGYPPDCADRDDGRPCDIWDSVEEYCEVHGLRCDPQVAFSSCCKPPTTLGLCWKGNCTAVDCGTPLSSSGVVGGFRCWSFGDDVGECSGPPDNRCYTRMRHTPPDWLPVWSCHREYYGTGDGCDCGCRILDPDCADGTVDSCDYCELDGSCPNYLGCPGDIDPTRNWLCVGAPVCGDGVAEPPEQCDRADVRGLDCTYYGFTGGTLACTESCTFDVNGCTGGPVCGDDAIQAGELCDGTDLGELSVRTCADLGFTGGTLVCNATCDNFDTTGCTGGPPGWTCKPDYYDDGDTCECGCGVFDPDCTDSTVGSCWYCGHLGSCSPLFPYCPGDIDPAQNWLCLGGTEVCGNDVVEHGELCDGDDLRGLDCTDLNFTEGTLVCTMECTFDTSGCTGGAGGNGGG